MVIVITLTAAGVDTGPFDLFSNANGYSAAFETGVSKAALLAGYTTLLAPPATTIVRVKSAGTCTNQIDIPIVPCSSTTTTTSSSTSSTTSTSTSTTSTTSTTTTIIPPPVTIQCDCGTGCLDYVGTVCPPGCTPC